MGMTEKRTETEQDQVVEADAVVDDADREPTADDLGLVLPEDPEEAVRYLLRKVQEAREEASSYLDDLKRVAADFDNYRRRATREIGEATQRAAERSEEHTSELQSRENLVCRLLLDKKKTNDRQI